MRSVCIMFKQIILLFLLITLSSTILLAEPFDSSTITLDLVSNINKNDFHNFWEPKTGFELDGRTDFYIGMLELGFTYNKNKSKSIDQPDYNSIFSYIGFGFNYKITKSLSNYTGFRVGNYYMDFDDELIHSELKSEHELGIGFNTSLQYSFIKKYALNLSLEHQKIFTYKRIYLWSVSAGVNYSFGTPKWLKEFLQ